MDISSEEKLLSDAKMYLDCLVLPPFIHDLTIESGDVNVFYNQAKQNGAMSLPDIMNTKKKAGLKLTFIIDKLDFNIPYRKSTLTELSQGKVKAYIRSFINDMVNEVFEHSNLPLIINDDNETISEFEETLNQYFYSIVVTSKLFIRS